jgi:hypothetical protein
MSSPEDPFAAIEPGALEAVSGGRTTPVETIDPALIQGVGELAKAVSIVGQNLVASQQQSSGQMMQMLQQMMQARGGR